MLFTIAAAIVLLFVSIGALIGALTMTRRARLEMDRRVKLVAAPAALTTEVVGVWLRARSTNLATRLQRFFAAGAGRSWGMEASALVLLTVAVIATAAAWSLTYVALGLPFWIATPIALLAGFLAPRLLLLRQQRKVERRFIDLFPDAVDSIARMLRAGLPITSAMRAVSDQSSPPIKAVFAVISNEMEIGTPLEDALDASSRALGLADFRFFAVAIVLQHATGGNLAATLEILSDIIRKRRAVRLKASATTAEIRVSAYVLGSLPFLIVGVLLLIRPGYLAPLFFDPRGHVILAIAAGSMLAAVLTMRQMMRSVSKI